MDTENTNTTGTENVPQKQFEHCVMCGALTCIPVDMPIDWRENYEVGCGQLCAECAGSRRKTADQERMQMTADMLRAKSK